MEIHGANQMIDECDECHLVRQLAPHPENWGLYLCEQCINQEPEE